MSSSSILRSAEIKLESGESLRLGHVLDQLFLYAGVLAVDGIMLDVNRGPLEAAGLDAADVLGVPFWDTWWWGYDDAVRHRIRGAFAEAALGRTVRFDVLARVREDDRMLVDLQLAPLRDDDGRLLYVIVSALDLTEREAAREALTQSERRARARLDELELIYGLAPLGLGLVDRSLNLVRLNQRFADLSGDALEHLRGRRLWEVVPDLRRDLAPALDRVLAGERSALGLELSASVPARSAEPRHWRVELYPVPGADGPVERVGIIAEDITARKSAEERLARTRHEVERQALHDALTGLPNRTLLSDRAEQLIAAARRGGGRMALLIMDLDDFKGVNDTLGHAAGDALLEQVAVRLSGAVRETDTVGRLGGDEFAVVTGPLQGPQDAAAVAERILDALREPVSVLGRPHVARASIGIAVFPDDARRLGGVFRCADLAMYEAKRGGGARAMFFEAQMREQLRMRQQLEQALRRAVEERTLTLRPSARHALVDGRLVAVEAELVWRHPVRGLVSIEDDLVFAERKGLGRVIADIALDRIFAFLPELRRQSPACRLCVAFSPTQLANPGLVESLLERLEAAGLEGDQLQVELLTGVAWSLEGDALVAPLRRLAAAGINVGLRGFGADHVAFHELRHLPLDSLILASELVADLGRRDEAEVFLEALAGLGRRLGKRVVARGVATPDQMEILSQSGCEEAAGPLFAGETNAPAVRRAG